MPSIVAAVPGKSNFFTVSTLNFCFGVVSFGTVNTATILIQVYTTAMSQGPALQLAIVVAMPPKMVPNTKPSGLPAEKAPKALFFLLDGFS